MKYLFNSDICPGVPKGSTVSLIDIKGDQVAFIYKKKRYEYYSFSLFTPKLKLCKTC